MDVLGVSGMAYVYHGDGGAVAKAVGGEEGATRLVEAACERKVVIESRLCGKSKRWKQCQTASYLAV
jgi:hypothetical protein